MPRQIWASTLLLMRSSEGTHYRDMPPIARPVTPLQSQRLRTRINIIRYSRVPSPPPQLPRLVENIYLFGSLRTFDPSYLLILSLAMPIASMIFNLYQVESSTLRTPVSIECPRAVWGECSRGVRRECSRGGSLTLGLGLRSVASAAVTRP